MRALTIWQPWAELVVRGYKRVETRSWPTNVTGPVVIHAAKYRRLDHQIYLDIWRALGYQPQDYKGSWLQQLETGEPADRFGAVLGTACIIRCAPMVELYDSRFCTRRERALGDWTAGRHGFCMDTPKRLIHPVPARGQQGFWNWDWPVDAPKTVKKEDDEQ